MVHRAGSIKNRDFGIAQGLLKLGAEIFKGHHRGGLILVKKSWDVQASLYPRENFLRNVNICSFDDTRGFSE
jgi:hypothetical protein